MVILVESGKRKEKSLTFSLAHAIGTLPTNMVLESFKAWSSALISGRLRIGLMVVDSSVLDLRFVDTCSMGASS